MAKRKTLAYFFWLIGGWFGLHHFYLGRDRQAFIWWCTLGGFCGVGWLRDIFRIPSYVADANDDPEFVRWYTELIRTRKGPKFSVTRFSTQLFVGTLFGFLAACAVPNELAEEYPLVRTLLTPFAVALGVYTVGNIGREVGPLKYALIGAYIPSLLFLADPNIVVYLSICSAILFRKGVDFRRTPATSKTQGVCKRLVVLGLAGSLIWVALGSAFYHNVSVTTSDGESIRVKDALNHFFESPAWRDFKEVLWHIWNSIWERGWRQAYSDFVEALDPEGEGAAYKVLELEEGASQEEITKRYRKLARTWHPDKHSGAAKEEAAEKFMQVQNAYETLSKIKARRAASQSRHFEKETRRY